MGIMSNFGERLNELIFDSEISLQKLADDLGITLQSIYRYKANNKDVKLSSFFSIAKYFNCSLDYLAGRSDDDSKIFYKKSPSNLADSVLAILKEKNLSVYALKKQTHYDYKSIKGWEKSDPYLSTLIVLANYFDCTIDHLVGLE